jgi:glycosyltransferase involved in cell wall biosynthesis
MITPLERDSTAPRVLLLSTSLGLGGADRQIIHLARALRAHGYEVRMVSMTPIGEMGQQGLAGGLPISSLNMRRGRADWRSFQQLVTLLRSWRPHVLTSFMYHANLMGRVAGRWAGVPLIISSIRSEWNGTAIRDWLMRLTNWMDHSCTTNSQQVADSLRKRALHQSRKLRVIPNGVDIAAFTPPAGARLRIRDEMGLAPDEFLWLAIGRLWEQKDYPTLLRAFAPLANAPARLAIAGRGPLLDELRRQAAQLGVASRVTFLGVRHDIGAILSAADGFVLSSAWEGMPNVVMEALAAATPVAATQVGGVSEVVQEGRSGFLVPPRDPAALSRAMQQLMSLPVEQRRQMGIVGRDHMAAYYSLPAMTDRWLALYDELLAQRGVSAASSARQPGAERKESGMTIDAGEEVHHLRRAGAHVRQAPDRSR